MYTINCKDAGMDCDWHAQSNDKEDLIDQAMQHLEDQHDIKDTPQMREGARQIIKEEAA